MRDVRHGLASIAAQSTLIRASSSPFAILLLALVGLLLFSPVVVRGRTWAVLLGLLASAVVIAGLHATRPGRKTLWFGVGLAVCELLLGQISEVTGWRWMMKANLCLWLVTLSFVSLRILDTTFNRDVVDLDTILAALCVYLIMGMFWSYFSLLIELLAPGSYTASGEPIELFHGESTRQTFFRFLSYSYSTLSGVGDAEIQASTGFAKMCGYLQAISVQIYLAVVIARVVGMHTGDEARRDRAKAALSEAG